jgi:hypothetical protein
MKITKLLKLIAYLCMYLVVWTASHTPIVLDPGKGVCADPVNGAAILGKEGPDPRGGNKGRQLSPDKGREKA